MKRCASTSGGQEGDGGLQARGPGDRPLDRDRPDRVLPRSSFASRRRRRAVAPAQEDRGQTGGCQVHCQDGREAPARRAARATAEERQRLPTRPRRARSPLGESRRSARVARGSRSRASSPRRARTASGSAPGRARTRPLRRLRSEDDVPGGRGTMRIWIDLSAPAHPVRCPSARAALARSRARGRGDRARLRADARTGGDRRGLDALRGRRARRCARPPASCAVWPAARAALWRWARTRPRSTSPPATARTTCRSSRRALRVPAVDLFDYEWATFQHMIGCRLARRVIVPDAIPPERLRRYGAGPRSCASTQGSRRSTSSTISSPTRASSRRSAPTLGGSSWCCAAAHRGALPPRPQPGLRRAARRLGHDPGVFAVVLPRLREQADELQRLALPSIATPCPQHAVDERRVSCPRGTS